MRYVVTVGVLGWRFFEQGAFQWDSSCVKLHKAMEKNREIEGPYICPSSEYVYKIINPLIILRVPYLRRTPPSSDALRHSGGESLRCTSATVTLYFDVELSSDKRPGTEQNTSAGDETPEMTISFWSGFLIPGTKE